MSLSGKSLIKYHKRCKHPECKRVSTTYWALVPLCADHHESIRKETVKYYQKTTNMAYSDRVEYLKIAKQIPWSGVNLGEVMPDGSIRGD